MFGEAVPLTGVVLAKLDSTAKGGVIIGIAERLKLPVRFVGLGENLRRLAAFRRARIRRGVVCRRRQWCHESGQRSYAA